MNGGSPTRQDVSALKSSAQSRFPPLHFQFAGLTPRQVPARTQPPVPSLPDEGVVQAQPRAGIRDAVRIPTGKFR